MRNDHRRDECVEVALRAQRGIARLPRATMNVGANVRLTPDGLSQPRRRVVGEFEVFFFGIKYGEHVFHVHRRSG